MALTDAIEGGNANISQNTTGSQEHMQELTMLTQDGKHFPFLRLPAEIKNQIYEDVLGYDLDRMGPVLLDQPAITRVNRQTRAEALQLYYRFSGLDFETKSSEQWVPFVQKVLDTFNGGPGGLPSGSQSTLRFLSALQVSFMTSVPELKIIVEFNNDPAASMEMDPEDDDCEAVVVGSPDMDWTDAAAVHAACDDAARKLADDITRRTTPEEGEYDEDVELVAASTPAEHRAALDALRLIALACPSLRPSVYICDVSDIEVWEGTDGYSTDEDEYFDEDGFPNLDGEYPDGYDNYLDWIEDL